MTIQERLRASCLLLVFAWWTLAYLPGRGIELLLNGTRLVLETDAKFARASFGIWLGADPLDRGLRDRLLQAPPLTGPLDSTANNG